MYYGQLYFILISFIALAIPSHAKTIFVDDNASTGGDGTSWASAHKYLQDALASAEYGDEIWVAEGTYKPDQGAGKTAGDRASPFVLVNGVGMYGGFLGTENSRDPQGDNNQTILSGEINEDSELWSLNVVSGVDLDANTILDGFRITKGNANGKEGTIYENGGGGYLRDSEIKISNCVFTNNSANRKGGGIYSYSSPLTLTNCVFTNNSAGSSGGVYLERSETKISNCVFTNNSADYDGGGIGSYMNSSTLTNCVFTNNSAVYSAGGGISSYSSTGVMSAPPSYYTLTLINCVFMNNSADKDGGGISSSATLTLTNCVFSNNSANRKGGGISSSSSPLTLTNCVFTNNSANSNGGGIYTDNHTSSTLTNCVLTNNSAVDHGGGIYSPYSSPLTLTNSILWKNYSNGATGHGLKVVQPELFESFVLQEAIEAEYPGDPNARDVVYEPNLNILHGWSEDARAFDADPQFVNIDNPVGPDGIWFTEDDGLRLQASSPAIDSGYDFNDSLKYDMAGFVRRQGSSIDIGAYEFGDFKAIKYSVYALASPTYAGLISGDGTFEEDEQTSLSAVANKGYLFSNWTGDFIGTTNPVSIIMDSDKSITANFTQDLNDDDGDGLTNFAELVTYGTDPSKQDTDNDGILDAKEIEIGSDPKSSDSAVFNFGRDEGVAEGKVIGRSEGEQSVIGNPGSFGLVTKESYDLLQSKLEECESAKFPWVEFDDFSDSTLDSEKWEIMWWHGAQPPTTSNGMLVLNGNGQLHSPPSRNSPLVQAFIDSALPPGEIPTNHSIAEVKAEGIYGLQAKLMVPNGSAKETGVGMGAVKFNEDGTRHQFEFEIGYWDENNDILSLEFDYRTPGLDQEKVAYYRQGEFDKFYEVSLIHLNGTNFLYFGEELIFEFNATWAPNSFNFFAFNDQDPDWKPFKTYVKDVKVLVPGTPNPVPNTPYTPSWFYLPNHGWLWTNRTSYPYFYDSTSKAWMYFQSGNEKPRFYHYGTKEWITME